MTLWCTIFFSQMGWTSTSKLVGSTISSPEENSCQNVWTWNESRYMFFIHFQHRVLLNYFQSERQIPLDWKPLEWDVISLIVVARIISWMAHCLMIFSLRGLMVAGVALLYWWAHCNSLVDSWHPEPDKEL